MTVIAVMTYLVWLSCCASWHQMPCKASVFPTISYNLINLNQYWRFSVVMECMCFLL